jgi:exodeoxyribonuclease V alpha subunit
VLREAGLVAAEGEWYAGRPVMVTRNDAQLGVFNGDIGMALPSFADAARLRVYFLRGDGLHHVSTSRLAQVETAFAMTVHKSQGSEFAHTALVLAAQGGSVLGRELVYTGITRAREAFTLWSEVPGLLASAIGSPTQRSSGLLRFWERSV